MGLHSSGKKQISEYNPWFVGWWISFGGRSKQERGWGRRAEVGRGSLNVGSQGSPHKKVVLEQISARGGQWWGYPWEECSQHVDQHIQSS